MRKPKLETVLLFVGINLAFAAFGGSYYRHEIWLGGADFRLQFTHDGEPDTHGPELICARGASLGGLPCLPTLSIGAGNVEWIQIVLHDTVSNYDLISQATGNDEGYLVDWIHLRLTRGSGEERRVIDVRVDSYTFTLDAWGPHPGSYASFPRAGEHSDTQTLKPFSALLEVATKMLYEATIQLAGLDENSGFNEATLWVKVEESVIQPIFDSGTIP